MNNFKINKNRMLYIFCWIVITVGLCPSFYWLLKDHLTFMQFFKENIYLYLIVLACGILLIYTRGEE